MLITVETTCLHVFILTSIKVIKNDEICVEVALLPHKHLTMTDQTTSRPTFYAYKYVLYVQKKTTRIASRASCVIHRITLKVSSDVSYKSVVCGNTFGTRF